MINLLPESKLNKQPLSAKDLLPGFHVNSIGYITAMFRGTNIFLFLFVGSSECIPSTRCKKVLFVYPDGCEYIKSFVMLIGQLLHANSCECILDLVNRRQVDTAGGRDQFILDNLDEAGCVIVVYYRGKMVIRKETICHQSFCAAPRYSPSVDSLHYIGLVIATTTTWNLQIYIFSPWGCARNSGACKILRRECISVLSIEGCCQRGHCLFVAVVFCILSVINNEEGEV